MTKPDVKIQAIIFADVFNATRTTCPTAPELKAMAEKYVRQSDLLRKSWTLDDVEQFHRNLQCHITTFWPDRNVQKIA